MSVFRRLHVAPGATCPLGLIDRATFIEMSRKAIRRTRPSR